MSPSPFTASIRILVFALLIAFCTRSATARPFYFRPYFQALSATGPESEGARVAMAPASPPQASGVGGGRVPPGDNGNSTVLDSASNATLTNSTTTAPGSVPSGGAAYPNGARGAGFPSSFVLSVVAIGAVGVQLM
ncbi:hypothetical protein BU17DRAFT_101787 [Hysterangium stoloniferum]|nr:hypothetical protein BU17DRAFT_101787 [Hysterangium stoloniferum]